MWFEYNPHFSSLFSKFELNFFSGIYTKKVYVVLIYVILRLYLCNLTIKAGDINSLNLLVGSHIEF